MARSSRGVEPRGSGAGRERRFSVVGALTGLVLGVLPFGVAVMGGSMFRYVGFFFLPLAMVLSPVLALFCGTLPMWWPARSDPILALMKFLGLCLALAVWAGGAIGLVLGLMFALPIFFVGLFGIVAHAASRPWDGHE